MRVRLLVLSLLATLLVLPAGAGASARKVPLGWMGVSADAMFTGLNPLLMAGETARMTTAGVESVRAPFFWAAAQGCASCSFDFTQSDRLVRSAARQRLRVLPVLLGTPAWDAIAPGSINSRPRGTGSYASYVRALVRRYGPRGSFWSQHRKEFRAQPIRAWQIWNEPHFGLFFCGRYDATGSSRCHDTPWVRPYVALLRAARTAIKRQDRHGRIVLAGLTNYAWRYLDQIYRAGGRRLFDVVAVHAYTATPSRVLKILQLARGVMNRHGDRRKPMMATELTWSSGQGLTSDKGPTWVTTERGQARRVGEVYSLLSRQRRRLNLTGAFWQTWLSPTVVSGRPWTQYDGLLKLTASGGIVAKPALGAYRGAARRLEGCSKRRHADRCG